MMDLSFRWPHPRFETSVGPVSVRLHTFENAYGVDPEALTVESIVDGGVRIEASGLSWAGGQRTSDGSLSLVATPTSDGLRIETSGVHADGVRSIAVTLHDVPVGIIGGVREGELDVPSEGRLLRYPNGWFDLASPSFTIDGSRLAIRSLDDKPQPKTFSFIPHFDDPSVMDVELIVEVDATHPTTSFTAPAWIVATGGSVDQFQVRHREHIAESYPVDSWETRTDVPAWMQEVSLVLTLHGQHFTGRTFLDYEQMRATIRDIAGRIDGKRVLAYIPGWEGRYYRGYGAYRAEPTMGGVDGFTALVTEAQALGVHVMPMFGANIASRDVPGFERWGEPGILRRPSGLRDAGSVDWDGSRHYDYGGGALLNPAFAPWRAQLVSQIAANHELFGFDATFLDITAMHANDPTGDTTQGLRDLVDEIHTAIPGHLVAGEAWFDAISAMTPLVQTGHHHTVPVHHDLPDDGLFTRSNRSFGHVCLGDPAHGSSGVHEAGYVADWRLPVRRAIIPTLSVVEDTLAVAPERVQQIVEDATVYAEKYL